MKITNNIFTEEGLRQACDDCNKNFAQICLVPKFSKRVIRLCKQCAITNQESITVALKSTIFRDEEEDDGDEDGNGINLKTPF